MAGGLDKVYSKGAKSSKHTDFGCMYGGMPTLLRHMTSGLEGSKHTKFQRLVLLFKTEISSQKCLATAYSPRPIEKAAKMSVRLTGTEGVWPPQHR